MYNEAASGTYSIYHYYLYYSNRLFIEEAYKHFNKRYHGSLSIVDLHGLFVKEALVVVEQHLLEAKAAGMKHVTIITGNTSSSLSLAVMKYSFLNSKTSINSKNSRLSTLNPFSFAVYQ